MELSEYKLKTLRKDGEVILYRGQHQRPADASPPSILAVTTVLERPALASLKKIEHEYSLRDELDPAWAARPLALCQYKGQTMLVLTDPGGELLHRILERREGQPIELTRVLRIAIGLAAAVGRLHRQGLIHKDITPANVLVDDAGQVRMMGFGIASRFARERQSPEPPEFIAGTLAYMAPEQTGRMNRSIDSRSDLYSLGVTLYEMLTSMLPFTASEPMEWVHCHIARQPVPPSERRKDVPRVLSAIIMKLLAKTAEERYQTAAGLERDLRRCHAQWEAEREIGEFPLGEHDTPDRLLIPEKLYGREREVETLLVSFDRVVTSGTAELVLVSGYSGIGKSSVVNELHKVLVLPRGLFASGKFDQYKRDIPYSTLAQAFQSLIRHLLAESEANLAPWRDALREALGPNGQLMLNLVPELELIIGEQPPVAPLEPQQARARFRLVLRRFIEVFARPEHPLALFLDDLQWLDAATLELLEDLLTRSDLRHLLVIGAYRDNEVTATHPLMRKLDAIKTAGAKVAEITLAPLAREHLERLIADALRCESERAAPLMQLVHEKTGGNPFFAIQFISSLAEERLLTFDHGKGWWSWDLNRIHAKGYTDNVVDLMIGKLNRLPPETQSALQQLACLGNIAEIPTLLIVLGTSEASLHFDLSEAVRQKFVERLEGSYRFVHDRVQEAVYSLIPEERRTEAHLRIGRLLRAQTPPEKREEAIFDIVNQLNRGAVLMTSPDEREQLAELDFIAGKRAKASTAYASALSYFAAGAALLSEDYWERGHELTFELELHRAECEFLTGALAVAEERLAALSNRAATTVEGASVACLRVDLYTTVGQSSRAVTVALDYLRQTGIDWSPHPTDDDMRRMYERVTSRFGSRAIEDLIDLPLMTEPASLATMDVLTKLKTPAAFTNQNLYALAVFHAVSLSIERGNTEGSCAAYVAHGIIAGQRFGDYEGGFRFGQVACELVERRGWRRVQARVHVAFAAEVLPHARHVRNGCDLLRCAFQYADASGDLTFSAYGRQDLSTHLLAAGDPLADVQGETESALAFAQKAQFSLGAEVILPQLGLIRTLRGLTPTFGSFDDKTFDERRTEQRLSENPEFAPVEYCYWIYKLQARFFAGDYTSAIDASSSAERVYAGAATLPFAPADYRFFSALAYAAVCDSATPEERREHLEAVVEHHQRLVRWAQSCPENFENRAALVGAEIARLEGRELDAERLYEQAIRSARKNGFVQNEALAYERASAFYRIRGFEEFADRYLQHARHCYLRWGADGKVRQLDELYPDLAEKALAPPTTSMIATPVEHLDLATVIKVSQAVSGEIVLERLIEMLMRTALEHAGAERGLLLLARGAELRIEAEAMTSGDSIGVHLRDQSLSVTVLPRSMISYVLRTRETVILDDASAENPFSADPYIRERQARSVLCLPLINRAELVGVLYLENNLAPRVFAPARMAVLKLLVSQAAISLENARLYAELINENRDRQKAEDALRRSDSYLAEAQSLSHTGSFGWIVSSGEIFWSEETFRIFEYDSGTKPTTELVLQRVHPEDRAFLQQIISRASRDGKDFDLEYRLLMPGESIKHLHVVAHAIKDELGQIEFVGAVTDITTMKRAEQRIREDERELRQLINFVPGQILVMQPDGARLYANEGTLEYYGMTLEDVQAEDFHARVLHPDDLSRVLDTQQRAISDGTPWEAEARLLRKDGQYRWFLIRSNSLRDEQAGIIRWYTTAIDIDDRKHAEEKVQKENIALREEIDKVSMFEEIVGSSGALRKVLSDVAKVAPTDSTVLITGETGTGKELIARAIHKRSRRSSRAFISVNCAAIPQSLIASELFGHEKGAFTGALQRRLGRFELAEGGTIFLDEIGNIPGDTQNALLRVLQEREFERVGGSQSIRANVRVIAATNLDLEAAIDAGAFREDLFFRLKVFPIEIPPLRDRREDIAMLVEYFIDRYSSKLGNKIASINKQSLKMLQSYAWPGNIRELQNIIERAVIVCESESLVVDENWLVRSAGKTAHLSRPLSDELMDRERQRIEAALAETKGRVSGPTGAAAKLGIPRSTLDSKIKSLKISPYRFKTS